VGGSGAQLLAGTKLCTARPAAGGELRVVLWDGKAHRKLLVEESPTQASLCAYLKAHPHVQVYTGQTPPVQPRWAPAEVMPASAGPAAGAKGKSALGAGVGGGPGGKMISLSNAKSMMPKHMKHAALGLAHTPTATATASFAKAKPLLPSNGFPMNHLESPATLRKPVDAGLPAPPLATAAL